MNISVVLPTRGLVFCEVENALEKQREEFNLKVFRSWDLPIPDSHNFLVEKALEDKDNKFILMLEEDVVIPKDGIKLMLGSLFVNKADIAFIDYGVNSWSCSATNEKTNKILWCGIGCTLIKREVFETLDKPWFRTDKTLRLNDWKWIDNPAKYGGQDIWFCTKAREKNFTITKIGDIEAKHLKLDSLGIAEYNNGLHKISEKPKIEKYQLINF